MELLLLTPETWRSERRKLLGFVIRNGEKRITTASLQAFRDLEAAWLESDGSGHSRAVIAVTKQGGRMTGLGFAADGGDGGCLLVVHPGARRLGAGTVMMKAMINRLGRLACHVAADNIPSMALCFRLGMKAVSIHKGPTGKSTLRFERGILHDAARTGHIDTLPQ
ncbi:GNAT family N-acetyltransferase [Paenibacillus sp. LHD-117]|uniref:GNAT family N-acetyltransferase n=1 Tax=Paenibacillus sp. LHD-117 TaxID=3071412 RepID=UPI0027E19D61|nr:GNAT family N-acetyltransferase [Paenibacillus sp. LHD-117]MDQ6422351.1 GNAT family N-acetyltransferase [Paenibacillus sp. LHD-117]